MPTTLPVRSPECVDGRKRGLTRSGAALLIWAVALLALTLPVDNAHTATASAFDMVSP